MAASIERKVYIKQIEQMCEEGKKYVNVPSTLINDTINDEELGRLVRDLMNKKIVDCENHVRYMKSL